MEPASIRYKNPGAMWGRNGKRTSSTKLVATNIAIPLKWGSTETYYLSDGLGQGNNIAVFKTYVAGICAQLDLWRTNPKFANKKFSDAIDMWAGHNYVDSYIAFVLPKVPGMTRNTVMDDAFWKSDKGVAFLKAQAWHEAGKKYPAPDGDWLEAQRIVLGVAPVKPKPAPVPKPETVEDEPEAPPEPDDTKPHAAEPESPKSGITAGAKGVVGVGAVGLATQAWDTVSQAPETILQAIVKAMTTPQFWIFAAVVAAGFYIWWRRSNMKKAGP